MKLQCMPMKPNFQRALECQSRSTSWSFDHCFGERKNYGPGSSSVLGATRPVGDLHCGARNRQSLQGPASLLSWGQSKFGADEDEDLGAMAAPWPDWLWLVTQGPECLARPMPRLLGANMRIPSGPAKIHPLNTFLTASLLFPPLKKAVPDEIPVMEIGTFSNLA